MADINALLNKKGWTGRELGILEVTNMCRLFAQTMQGITPAKPLIEKDRLKSMINGLTSEKDIREFNYYIDIHSFLSTTFAVKGSNTQQLQLRQKVILDYLKNALLAEDIFYYIDELPAIMTEKQYNEEREKRTAEYLDGIKLTPMQIIIELLEANIKAYEENPRKTSPYKELFKRYATEPIKSKYTLERYNEATDNGYYTLPDGRRSDQMTDEEWEEVAKSYEEKENQQQEAEEQKGFSITDKRFMREALAVYNDGLTPYEAEELIKEEDGLKVPREWHIYEEPPADLTKWEAIADTTYIYELYRVNEADDIKAFIEDFEELAELLKAEAEKLYFKGFSKIPYSEYHIDRFSGVEAYSKNFVGFDYMKDDSFLFDGERGNWNGIAILKPNWNKHRIDENGYFIEPPIYNSLKNHSLEAFFTDNEDYAYNVATIEASRESILESYYFLSCLDYIIDATAKLYDLPDIKMFGVNISSLKEMIDALNTFTPVLYTKICRTRYQDEETKQKKLQVLKDIFYPIEYDKIEIPTAKIDELIQDTKNFEDIINTLIDMHEEARGADNE